METTGQTKICGFDKNAQKSEVIFCQRSKSKKFNTLEKLKWLESSLFQVQKWTLIGLYKLEKKSDNYSKAKK